MKLKHNERWGWGIHDLKGWGIYGLNGWGIYNLNEGHLWLKWVGQLVIVFWEICSKTLVVRGVLYSLITFVTATYLCSMGFVITIYD